MPYKDKWPKIIRCAALVVKMVVMVVMLVAILTMSIRAQDTRFTNNQYSVAFQPPAGWLPTLLVQYEGPQRQDGGHPALSLSADDRLIDIGEEGATKLVDEFVAEFSEQGFEDVKMLARRKFLVAGLDAFQMDLGFKGEEAAVEIRRVFVPVKQQNRTYIFTLSDNAADFAESAAAADN